MPGGLGTARQTKFIGRPDAVFVGQRIYSRGLKRYQDEQALASVEDLNSLSAVKQVFEQELSVETVEAKTAFKPL